MGNYTVYKHTSPNGKIYIGITSKNPIKRWNGGTGYLTNDYFTKAIKKYGWNNFLHEILMTDLSKADAEAKEIELISLFRSDEREYGYNIQHGGFSRGKHSNETKNKISKANKGRKPWICGGHHSEKAKRKISDSRIGTHLSEETKKKISDANKGRKQDKEVVKKRADACCKAVICIEKDKTFKSIKTASKYANVVSPAISACLKGKSNTAGGYHWKYADTIQVI